MISDDGLETLETGHHRLKNPTQGLEGCSYFKVFPGTRDASTE